MSTAAYILFLHGPTWQIARVEGGQVSFAEMMPPEQGATPQAIAKRAAEELRRSGYVGQPTVLALGAGGSLAGAIENAGLPPGRCQGEPLCPGRKGSAGAGALGGGFSAAADRGG